MHVLLLAQYFKPESVGAAIWIHQLAVDLIEKGHDVSIVTGFPNYPSGRIFSGYRNKLFQREEIDGVHVIRTYIYATPERKFLGKLLNFASFSASAGLGALMAPRPDVIYAILPPLPLGVTAKWSGLLKRVPTIVNIQDVWPDAPLAAGLIGNGRAVKMFRLMERSVYRGADLITVISEGFKRNLLTKGVPEEKIQVIPNWADPDAIQPGPRDNGFREELGIDADEFCLLYSGGLTYNSCLETAVEAMTLLRDQLVTLVIVGEGVKKSELQSLVEQNSLSNVRFLPFQSLERYPKVLAAADMCLVTLGRGFSFASVPSKTFKIMAAGRPVLALAADDSDLANLVVDSASGLCIAPEDAVGMADVLRYMIPRRDELRQMGMNGRVALEQDFSRAKIIDRVENVMKNIVQPPNTHYG